MSDIIKDEEKEKKSLDKDKLGHRKRLRQTYVKQGIDSFQDYEILEFLLTYVIKLKDTKKIAKELIKNCGSLDQVFTECYNEVKNMDTLDLQYKSLTGKKKTERKFQRLSNKLKVEGVGEETILFLSFLGDTTRRMYKEFLIDSKIDTNIPITKKSILISYLKSVIAYENIEKFYVIYLGTDNRVIDVPMEFQGTIDRSSIYIREILKNVLKFNAKSIVLVHNHPSGNLQPSKSDIDLTRNFINAFSIFDVKILDHIIISKYGFLSFVEEGII